MILPLIAGAGVLVTAGYNTMAPRSQLYGRTFIGEGRESRRLALTFDDGPNDPHTMRLLEVLDVHKVRATFFVIGQFVSQRPDIVRAIAGAGHAIGNHSFNHPNMIFCTRAEVRRQIAECERALYDATGASTRLFRPPYGGRRPVVLRTARAMGYEPIMWSVTAWDWKPRTPEHLLRTVTRQVRGGDVLLLHDGGHEGMGADRSATVRAAALIIERYRGEGYEFVTVPEMMEVAGRQ